MKGKLTALVLPVLATKFAFAQLPIVNSTLNQVGEIQQSIQKKLVEPLPARLAKIEPFALSQLPSIAEVITEPLNALPSRLSIPALNNAVEVQLDDGWRAIERQWVMLADNQSIDILQQHGASLLSQQPYPALDVVLLRFTVPASLDSKAALTQILGDDQVATLDRNHVYASQTVDETANPQSSSGPTKFPPKKLPMCEDSLRIGMLDTAIQTDHPAFANTTIVTHSFVENNSQEPQLHGTAIAGLLVGQGHA
ncbi:MAG: protease, partial [Paraglaciecola sp.]|nr:protease [Paraglaciecola sp.]